MRDRQAQHLSGGRQIREGGVGALDAVLCDMLMPDGTGIDVFEGATRAFPELASRFVFMTGGAFLPSLAEFLERIPNPRIEKPFGLPALEEMLDRVVETHRKAPRPAQVEA